MLYAQSTQYRRLANRPERHDLLTALLTWVSRSGFLLAVGVVEGGSGDDDPVAPADAVEWYVREHEEWRAATRRKNRTTLDSFLRWTDEAGIDSMDQIGGRELMAFRTWRKEDGDLKTISLNGIMAILRAFLQFCERIDAVAEGTAEAVPMPNVAEEDEICDEVPEDDLVEAVASYHDRYAYASREHVAFELVREVGLRAGAIRAIDIPDIEDGARVIHLRHRPEGGDDKGTPLKNGRAGERNVTLSQELADIVDAYVTDKRPEVTDCFGREPLLATKFGRISPSTLRRDFYKMMRPCHVARECPHERDPDRCRATKNGAASRCPSTNSPHPLRRWSIMRQLDEGVPKELLSDRVDVSVPVLEKHYDQRSKERKRRHRKQILERHLREFDSGA